jgi:IS5 family transposase
MNDYKSQSPASSVPATPFQAQPWLLLSAPDSELYDYCLQSHSLVVREPEILNRIEADLDSAAKEKKRLRLLDQQWQESHTADLPTIQFQSRPIAAGELKLGEGRPRLPAYLVFIFLMIRGYCGGFKTNAARVLREESVTLTVFLANQGLEMPGASTLSEHANNVSNATRQFILDAQIRQILDEGWDDFKSLTIDSTAVWANTGWPTDSQLMVDLARRFWHRGSKLEHFGIANLVDATVPGVLAELTSLNLKIQFSAGKPKSAGKRKGHYARLLRRVEKLAGIFQTQWEAVCQSMEKASLPPSQYARLQRLVAWMGDDVAHLRQIAGYCRERVMEGKTVGSTQKVLSLSDEAAGFIAKGQREPVIGYKPQLGRSRQGFISSVIIPLGNAADVSQLSVIVEESARRTGVLPGEISADDGYASRAIREQLLASGVKVVSISGSKGKKITSAEDWDSVAYVTARRERSAVESLMFTIKNGFDFGQVMRRGAEPVRAELLEKVLAYNCCRMVEAKREFQDQGKPAEAELRAA